MDLIFNMMRRFGLIHSLFPWGGGHASGSSVDIGDPIGYSCLWDNAASAYMSRTFGPPSGQQKGTIHIKLKLCDLTAALRRFCTDSGNQTYFRLNASHQLECNLYDGASKTFTSNRVFRGPDAHAFLTLTWDTTQAVAADRFKAWLGVEAITWTSAPTITQNNNISWGAAGANYAIGCYGAGTGEFLGAYISQFVYTDNQAYDYSSFVRLSADTGQPVAKTPAGLTYGNNGFKHDYTNNANLGEDHSGSFSTNLRSSGTAIGNMTGYTIANAFDGNTSQAYSTCATLQPSGAVPAHVGKDWGAGVTKTIRAFRAYAASDLGGAFTNSANNNVTLKLQGSTDNFSSSIVDLYTSGSLGAVGSHTVTAGITTTTAYRYHRLLITEVAADSGGHTISCAELELYEAGTNGINHWTLNNITSANQYTDTPTSNSCVLSVIDPAIGGATYTGAAGNLKLTTAATYAAKATLWPSSGRWWAEYTMTSSGTANGTLIGVGKTDANAASGTGTYTCYRMNGNKEVNGTSTAYGASYTSTDVIGMDWIQPAGTIEFFKQTGGVGAFVSQGVISGISTAGDVTFYGRSANSGVWNFGARVFNNTSIPSGARALNTANMATPPIPNPKLHFDAKTRTGTGAAGSVTSIAFKPDLVESKSRNNASGWAFYDSVRGATKELASSATAAESTVADGLTAFNADGFSFGADASTHLNFNGSTQIDYLWKMGGAAVSNTNGSITSSVSANTTAGQAVITYTGTAANGTFGHGLTKTPELLLFKPRNAVDNWPTWFGSFAVNEYFYLNNTTSKAAALATFMNTVLPDSTKVSIGTWGNVNAAAQTMVCYAFHSVDGYSKVFGYSGNSSADGTLVNCGFKPRYVHIFRTDAAADHTIFDSARNTYNGMDAELYSDLTSAESLAGGIGIDFTATGFKLRRTGGAINVGNYVGIAYAEAPTKYATAR